MGIAGRNIYWDMVKGFAIMLMLLGHSIQYGNGSTYLNNELYYGNWLFKIIYSFHMPLFIFVSGYFFFFSEKKYNFIQLCKSKALTILLPIVSVSILSYLIYFADFSDGILVNIENLCRAVLRSSATLWFLWVLLICTFVTKVVNTISSFHIYAYLFLIIAYMLLPDTILHPIWGFKFLFPFFLLGYYTNQSNWMKYIKEMSLRRVCILTLTYSILLLFYDHDSFIYPTKIDILNKLNPTSQFIIDIYRWVIGTVGCLVMLAVISKVKHNTMIAKCLSYLGVCSMGVYCFQTFYFDYVFNLPTHEVGRILGTTFSFAASIIFTVGLTSLIRCCSILNKLILGGR